MLRGIALNRRPGFHFPGNFLDVSFDRVSRKGVALSIEPGPWSADASGQTDLGALSILADLALGASIRAQLSRETRVATVSLGLQFTGAPRIGRLHARGEFQGFFERGAGRLGLGRVSVSGSAGQICYGTGSFMALAPPKGMTMHPVPLRKRGAAELRLLDETNLNRDEAGILVRADAALDAGGSFIQNFWEGSTTFANGLHAGNRVGHAQGGILLAMAAANATAALSGSWMLSALTALYISPGEGRTLKARSEVVHQGRLTAVARTRITAGRRRVLEVVTTHCASY